MSRGQVRKSNARKTSNRRSYNPEEHPAYLRSLEKAYEKVDNFEPLNSKQELYFELLELNQIIVATGEAGTGKTLCPVVHALDMLKNKEIETIYITKPTVEVGKSLGFLPGKIGDKFAPYMDSILEHVEYLVGKVEKHRLLAEGKIKCIPLEFMRGSNLDNCAIIADEMQNATLHQTRTLLTRLKENTKLIITGDLAQCDLEDTSTSGLATAVKVLGDVNSVGFINFDVEDIVRSGIVKEITFAFKKHGY